MRILVILAVGFSLTGCATVTRGTKSDVQIDVEPRNAVITTSLGHTCSSNPCALKVSRKESFTVKATAEGFEDAEVAVKTQIAGKGAAGLAGNAVAGGLIGIGVDAITGAANDHVPNPVIIKMTPIDGAPTSSNGTLPTVDSSSIPSS